MESTSLHVVLVLLNGLVFLHHLVLRVSQTWVLYLVLALPVRVPVVLLLVVVHGLLHHHLLGLIIFLVVIYNMALGLM